jgi:hypothetical protein
MHVLLTDYRSNSGASYVFTSSTNQVPIRTQLIGDRAGEPIENFRICLPDSQVLQPMGAEAIEPICVTIIIIDDDCKLLQVILTPFVKHSYNVIFCKYIAVVIGFKNSLEAVVEGGTTTVCAEVKPEGLRLDPFDSVPLIIRTNPGLWPIISSYLCKFLIFSS